VKERILKSMSNYSLKRIGSKLFNAFIVDGGDNYLELNFINENTEQHYSVTVKPDDKITQGHKNRLLEARIAELEKNNEVLNSLMLSGERRGVEKATIAHKDKIAELEKEKASHVPVLAWIARECNQVDGDILHRLKSYLAILKLEQQTKGVNDFANKFCGDCKTLEQASVSYCADSFIKALKEQGND
jgi:hypothetical protein